MELSPIVRVDLFRFMNSLSGFACPLVRTFSAPYQFRDGFQYLYNTPYSSTNSTIKMTPASHIRYKAHINSAVINVTYSSKYNESNNYLKIGYGGIGRTVWGVVQVLKAIPELV